MADENELRFGVRQEGILYSDAGALVGEDRPGDRDRSSPAMVLLFVAFPEKATPGEVDADILFNLRYVGRP